MSSPTFHDEHGNTVTPSTSYRDDEVLPAIYRTTSSGVQLLCCAHGWERCDLCGTDNRVMNYMSEHDVDYEEISEKFWQRQDAESKVMLRLHAERSTDPFMIGTTYAQRLYEEMIARHGDSLPPWPPSAASTAPANAMHAAVEVPTNVAGSINVLFIDGLGNTGFMADRLLGVPSKIPGVPASDAIEACAAWQNAQTRIVDFAHSGYDIQRDK